MWKPAQTCSLTISLYAFCSSISVKKRCSRYICSGSDTGWTVRAPLSSSLCSFVGSQFFPNSKRWY